MKIMLVAFFITFYLIFNVNSQNQDESDRENNGHQIQNINNSPQLPIPNPDIIEIIEGAVGGEELVGAVGGEELEGAVGGFEDFLGGIKVQDDIFDAINPNNFENFDDEILSDQGFSEIEQETNRDRVQRHPFLKGKDLARRLIHQIERDEGVHDANLEVEDMYHLHLAWIPSLLQYKKRLNISMERRFVVSRFVNVVKLAESIDLYRNYGQERTNDLSLPFHSLQVFRRDFPSIRKKKVSFEQNLNKHWVIYGRFFNQSRNFSILEPQYHYFSRAINFLRVFNVFRENSQFKPTNEEKYQRENISSHYKTQKGLNCYDATVNYERVSILYELIICLDSAFKEVDCSSSSNNTCKPHQSIMLPASWIEMYVEGKIGNFYGTDAW